MTKIADDATIATIWTKLVHPEEYVGGVAGNMQKCFSRHGDAKVKIGRTGKGIKPCYRITYSEQDLIFGSWWDNHQELSKADAINSNWSNASMTYAEWSAFLAKNFQPKRL